MRIRIPPKRVRERFLIIYELQGCKKAIDFLTEYYGIRRMRIVFNWRKVGKRNIALYHKNKAYFTKKGLVPLRGAHPVGGKRTVLHELYHHLVYVKGLELPDQVEENEANTYARTFLRV